MSTLPLFDQVQTPIAPPPSPMDERKRKKKLAYEATSEEWKAAVYEFATCNFLVMRSEKFIFEELTTAYERHAKRFNKPPTVEKRAFAGLQHRLLKEGLIEKIPGVFGRSYEGNLRPVYRSLI